MSANLNKTGLILMAFPLHVARFYNRTIIVLLIGKCVDKEVRQGIGESFFFLFFLCCCMFVQILLLTPKLCTYISELCVSYVICGPFVRLDVQ